MIEPLNPAWEAYKVKERQEYPALEEKNHQILNPIP